MKRFQVGALFGGVGSILSLLEFSLVFIASFFAFKNLIVAYIVGWYIVAAGFALVLLFGAFTAYKGRKALGGRILLVTAVSVIIINLALLLLPGPVGSMIPIFHYQPMIVGNWYILSIIGGIIIVTDKTEPKD